MLNIEFAQTYKPEFQLYNYQEELLNDLDCYRFLYIKQARQMGVSTMLAFHVANFLLNNTSNDNYIGLLVIKKELGYRFIDLLERILTESKIEYKRPTQREIKTPNGNGFRILTENNLISYRYHTLIVENAGLFHNLKLIYPASIALSKRLFVISGQTEKPLFPEGHVFKTIVLNYRLNKKFNEDWAHHMKSLLGDKNFEMEYDV